MTPAAILFDLDDTILACEGGDYLKLWMKSVEKYVPQFGGLDSGALFTEIRAVADAFWSDPARHRRGRLDIRRARQDIVIKAATNLNRPNDPAAIELANHYHDRRENNVVPFEGALDTLQRVRDRCIRTALITNGSADVQRTKIKAFGLERFFDLVLIEGEFGAGKPAEKVYRHALAELGVSPGQTWMVGDNLEWEVKAPQQLGIFGIWHDHMRRGLPEGSEIKPDKIVHRISEILPMLA